MKDKLRSEYYSRFFVSMNVTNSTVKKATANPVSINITNKFEKLMKNERYSCFHKYNLESEAFLLEDIHKSKKQPKPNETIFFIISSCFKNNSMQINKRWVQCYR